MQYFNREWVALEGDRHEQYGGSELGSIEAAVMMIIIGVHMPSMT